MRVKPSRKTIERAAVGKRRRRALQFVSKKRNRNKRIVVELVSAADVARLEARDDLLKEDIDKKIKDLNRLFEGLHSTLYKTMNRISELNNK